MRDGVKLHTVILVPNGAKHAPILLTRTPYSADVLTAQPAQRPPGSVSLRLRQRHRRDRGRRLYPGGPGYPRQVWLRGRLRDEPAPARAAESHARRRIDRHLRHHRLAGEECPREQRQGRHPGHLLRRFSAPDGGGASASRAQGLGAHEPHGGRLDGRRLVPQRSLPRTEHALHLRAGRNARQRREVQVVVGALRRLRRVHERRLGRRTGPPHGLEQMGFWKKILAHPGYDAFWSDQAMDKVLAADFAARGSRCP